MNTNTMMFKKENFTKLGVLLLVILSSSFYVYTIKEISNRGYSTSENMMFRGGICLFMGIVISKMKGYSIIPKNQKTQMIRFFTSGFASYFYTSSFTFLSASTIALIGRLDIPFLLILVALYTNQKNNLKSNLQFWLSVWTIVVVGYIAMNGIFSNGNPVGFFYAFLSILFIALGYLFMKNSANKENVLVLSNIFSLSILIFGFILLLIKKETLHFDIKDSGVFLLNAFSQIGIYALSVKLYKWYDVERARLPYVIATFTIYFIEIMLGQRKFELTVFMLSLIITGMIVTIILNPKTPQTKHTFLDNT
ncbi:hypothetical protein [Flavobacterium soyangense]|uniref:EamA domain-containing protein n=1 Tax=Flavobacterium soyangense TaxID=2023265 RepID=A0A930U6L9_9FLAO|nr:hypothetical protein [Flavobacterium soyangense]MBF2707873.1 hypothetical protein [Flavobacterium soyangense]